MPCLVCKYFEPLEPEEHRQLREAGQCQSNCGNKWDSYTALRYLQEHRKNITGWCLLHPEPKQKGSGHVCGQIEVPDYLYNHWKIERMSSDAHLKEWSQKQMNNLCNKSWTEQRNDQLEEDNRNLRRQLESSRKLSTSRLARLQKQKPVQPVQSVQPVQQLEPPQFPRLVAAE